MGAKKTLPTHILFDNVTVAGHTTVESEVINISNLDNVSIQFKYNTATIGVEDDKLKVLVSNDGIEFAPLNIPNMPSFDQQVLFTMILNLNQLAQPYLKLAFVSLESGEAYISASIFAKDLN